VSLLHRSLAPISAAGWRTLDDEARRVLTTHLAARKLVDFHGPLGVDAASVNTGRLEGLASPPQEGVCTARREVLPLIELRAELVLSRAELDAIDRGAADPELGPLQEAAKRMARAEDAAVFHGYPAAGIQGIDQRSSHEAVTLDEDFELYPRAVATATRLLRNAGVDGPYGIALGPRCYAGLQQATASGGYPILEMVRRAIDGPLVWAPAVNGAIVMSLRGGDFELTVGQDLSIGYASHDERSVRLYFLESLTFRVLTPEAAVAMVYRGPSPPHATGSGSASAPRGAGR
jgi:uncharacterized linocin/CFP29 family protein